MLLVKNVIQWLVILDPQRKVGMRNPWNPKENSRYLASLDVLGGLAGRVAISTEHQRVLDNGTIRGDNIMRSGSLLG